jgi:transcriptional regulator with XRE-family HTH domain
MYMTDSEIEVMYRQAKNPDLQVQVLADLNGCRLSDMQRKLAELGLRKPEAKKTRILPPREQIWQQLDDAEARALYAKGLKDRAVADAMGCSLYTIRQWRRANMVPPKKTREPRMDVKRAMELYLQGMTDEAIAQEIGASKSGVASWRFRNQLPAASVMLAERGEPVPRKASRRPSWQRIDYDAAKALYDQLLTDEEMAKRLDCSTYAVGEWRKVYHLPSAKGILAKQEQEKRRELRKAAEDAGKLVLHGNLGKLPLKITIEIGV